MAYTEDKYYTLEGVPFPKTEVYVSGLTAGQFEDVLHRGPSGVKARTVNMMVITPPSDGSDIRLVWDKDNDSTTNNTSRIRFQAEAGGSLTGATAKLQFVFGAMKSGGINP